MLAAQRPQGPNAPQQAAWNTAFASVNAHFQLESSWHKVKSAVESHLALLQKQAQVRVRKWLNKLSEETTNAVWKKNRNAYAKLLLEQLRCGKLAEPFNALPPDGPLPTLPKHTVYAFRPARSTSPPPQRATGAEQQASQQPQHAKSASDALDEYMAGGRQAGQRGHWARQAEETVDQQEWDNGVAGMADSDPAYLPGTRMPLRGAEAQRADRHQLADIAWQPSKFELEAELGACRERQRELEWRVQQAEAQLRQQSHLLQQSWRAGGLLEGGAASPLHLIDDGRGLPAARQRAGKKEIEELIEQYEERRRQWHKPSWIARGSPGGVATGGGGPLPPGAEDEMLGQLGHFQRQTDAIRQQLGQMAGGSGGGMGDSLSLSPATSLTEQLAGLLDLPEGTPLRQVPTGLRGGVASPLAPATALLPALFDGLPPSPLAAPPAAANTRRVNGVAAAAAYNRHIDHAGHHLEREEEPPAPPQPSSQRQQPAARPRSPIGPDVRHTLKSAAAAQRSGSSGSAQKQPGSAALLQLKQRRATQTGASPRELVIPSPAGTLSQQTTRLSAQQQPSEQPHAAREAAANSQQVGGDTAQQRPAASPFALPKDSNAALMADVRDLRDRLMSTVQQHEPSREASSPARQSRFRLTDPSDGELGGVGLTASSPALEGQQALTEKGDRMHFRLTDTSGGGLSGGGLSSELLTRAAGQSSEFNLEEFERQTEALRERIAAFRPL